MDERYFAERPRQATNAVGGEVTLLNGAVAQVDRDARAEIGDFHNRVLSASERLSRQISRSETGLQIAAGTYATAPWKSSSAHSALGPGGSSVSVGTARVSYPRRPEGDAM